MTILVAFFVIGLVGALSGKHNTSEKRNVILR